jgi:hypothetical protein
MTEPRFGPHKHAHVRCPECGTPTTWDPLRVEPGPTCPVCDWAGGGEA